MSDEFEVDGRSFNDGHDPMWTSTSHSDDSMTSSGLGSLHFYNASHGTTNGGDANKRGRSAPIRNLGLLCCVAFPGLDTVGYR